MPLDADAAATLEALAQAGVPPLDSLPPPEARVVFHEAFKTPPEGQEPVARVEDRCVPGPAGDIAVRLYAPASAEPLPVLVHYHGGGWVICDLDTHDGVCRTLANAARCAVLAVDYRLAPEHPYPAAFDDCWAVLRWVAEHGRELGLDPARLGVIGDSAGGNLAAARALKARDAGGPSLRLQVLTYPAVDPTMGMASIRENADGYLLTESSMHWFWGHYRSGGAKLDDPYLAPLAAADLAGLPPALVVTAEFDPLRDEGEAYARRLEQAGVKTQLRRFDGVFHGFALMGNTIAKGREALELEAQFVRQQLR